MYTTEASSTAAPAPKVLSPTSQFYRNSVPAILNALAVGFITYYSILLWHNSLDSDYTIKELQQEIVGLERDLEEKKLLLSLSDQKVDQTSSSSRRSWWKVW